MIQKREKKKKLKLEKKTRRATNVGHIYYIQQDHTSGKNKTNFCVLIRFLLFACCFIVVVRSRGVFFAGYISAHFFEH